MNWPFSELDKIVPLKKILPFFYFIGIVFLLGIIVGEICSNIPNTNFYKVELIGEVDEIINKPKDSFFYINDNWYLIKDDCIKYISLGDSIHKNLNSYKVIICDDLSDIKWQGQFKSLVFEVKAP